MLTASFSLRATPHSPGGLERFPIVSMVRQRLFPLPSIPESYAYEEDEKDGQTDNHRDGSF